MSRREPIAARIDWPRHEDFYTKFRMLPDFETEFAAHRFAYEGGRFEYQIPQEKVGRFNELTRARQKVQP